MRTFFRPRKSDAHRVACLSLYRALLQRCAAVDTSSNNTTLTRTLQSLVRYRFRNDRDLLSPSRIANGLRFGHSMLDLLDECSQHSDTAIRRLTEIVRSVTTAAQATSSQRRTLAAARQPTSITKLPKLEHIQRVSTKANQIRRPGNSPILQRPLPLSEISGGKRCVPTLVKHGKFPFLRYPSLLQPPALSRVIRQLNERHDRLWAQRLRLEETLVFAQDEDAWDELLEEHGVLDSESPSWTTSLLEADEGLSMKIKVMNAASTSMGHQMWDVVVKERVLAKQEEEEREARASAKKSQPRTSDTVLPSMPLEDSFLDETGKA